MTRSASITIAALAAALVVPLAGRVVADDEKPKIEKPKVEWEASPNFTPDERGKGKINYVIIHTVEGTHKGCVSWFKTEKSKVSAHYVVGFDGKITQMVKDKDRAWHAGVKLYNEEAIGIEHEGFAAKNDWTEKQVKASANLVRWLCHEYGIPIDRKHLLGHTEIAPKRKKDPGPYFNWDLYVGLVKDPKASLEAWWKKKPEEGPPAPAAPEPKKSD